MHLRFDSEIEVDSLQADDLEPRISKDRPRGSNHMPPRLGLRRCNGCGLEMMTSNGSHHVRIGGVKSYCGFFRLVREGSRAVRGGVTGESDG